MRAADLRPHGRESLLFVLAVIVAVLLRTGAIYRGSSLMSPSVFAYFPMAYRERFDASVPLGRDLELACPVLDLETLEESAHGHYWLLGLRWESVP